MEKSYYFFPNKECRGKFSINETCLRDALAPQSSTPANIYRALKAEDCSEKNFIPQSANPNVCAGYIKADPCSYCGLSVYTNQKELASFINSQRMTDRFPFWGIAAMTETEHGPIENNPTPPHHVTWHPYAGVNMQALFSCGGKFHGK